MKWLRHNADTYSNLKVQSLVALHGMEGYGLLWICYELVAQQGIDFKIEKAKQWLAALKNFSKLDDTKVDSILKTLGNINLIDQSELTKGNLYVPKMIDYIDETTRRRNREKDDSGDTPANSGKTTATKRYETIRNDTKRYEGVPFEKVWALYPLKKSKKKAGEKWQKLKPEIHALILADLPRRIEDDQWKRGFIPHMITYLNQERWEDEITKESPKANKIITKVDKFTN